MSEPLLSGLQARIIAGAIRFRGIVLALVAALLFLGGMRLDEIRYDVFPEFAPAEVGIQAEAPGLSPAEVEQRVTTPIEEALLATPGLLRLRSISSAGLAVITAFFPEDSDMLRNRASVAEKLATLGRSLPPGLPPPEITPLASSTSTVLLIGLTPAAPDVDVTRLRDLADHFIRPRLLAIPGVANAAVFGAGRSVLALAVDPAKLTRFGMGFETVLTAARQALGPSASGTLENANQRMSIAIDPPPTPETLTGRILSLTAAGPVTLGQVARLLRLDPAPIGAASIDGVEGVVIVISAQYGTDTIALTRRLGEALDALAPKLAREGVVLHTDLFRPADFIRTALGNVGVSLGLGAGLVILVLVLFLYNLRTAVISLTAIPLSLLAALLVLDAAGVSLNTMTLGGLAIAIGEVVDDAVIDVENIARRLRENAARALPRPAARVILEASLEVRGAVVHATLIVVLVFLPALALPGLAGRFFAPLALTYILALLASLATALTVTPALAALLLGKRHDPRPPPVIRFLSARFRRLLLRLFRHGRLVFLAVLLLFAGALALIPGFETAFLPTLNEGHLVLHASFVPGTSISQSLLLGKEIAARLHGIPEIRTIAQRIGRAELSEDTWGVEYSEFDIDLEPGLTGRATRAVSAEIRRRLAPLRGITYQITPFLTERIEETLSGAGAPLVVALYGADWAGLDQAAARLVPRLRELPGVRSVSVPTVARSPGLFIHLDETALRRSGLEAARVSEAIGAALGGETLGLFPDGPVLRPVAVMIEPSAKRDPAALATLPLIGTPAGPLPLGALARIEEREERAVIEHEGGRRVLRIALTLSGERAGATLEALNALLASAPLPPHVYAEISGSAVEGSRATRDLLVRAVFAAIGVFALLWRLVPSLSALLLLAANLPFALVGGIFAARLGGGLISLGAWVGFVTLFGLTLRNAIMLTVRYEQLARHLGRPGRRLGVRLAIRGAQERLAPIVMTSLVTALGLSPLIFGMDDPGREIEGPMALVILGGLMSSMGLTLLVLPLLAARFLRLPAAAEKPFETMANPASTVL